MIIDPSFLAHFFPSINEKNRWHARYSATTSPAPQVHSDAATQDSYQTRTRLKQSRQNCCPRGILNVHNISHSNSLMILLVRKGFVTTFPGALWALRLSSFFFAASVISRLCFPALCISLGKCLCLQDSSPIKIKRCTNHHFDSQNHLLRCFHSWVINAILK